MKWNFNLINYIIHRAQFVLISVTRWPHSLLSLLAICKNLSLPNSIKNCQSIGNSKFCQILNQCSFFTKGLKNFATKVAKFRQIYSHWFSEPFANILENVFLRLKSLVFKNINSAKVFFHNNGLCAAIHRALKVPVLSNETFTLKSSRLFSRRPVWPDWATLGNFLNPLAAINLSKYPTFLDNFCKVVKIYHFSSEIIFRQLL